MTEPDNRGGLSSLAEVRDVLVDPPSVEAGATLLPAHRMKKRHAGSSRELVLALNARVVFAGLSPTRSVDGSATCAGGCGHEYKKLAVESSRRRFYIG